MRKLKKDYIKGVLILMNLRKYITSLWEREKNSIFTEEDLVAELKDGTFISGGEDGKVIFFDSIFKEIGEIKKSNLRK